MVETDKFLVTNICQYLNSDNPKLGEDKLIQELSEFSCPQNADIEQYLKKSAIEFTKKNQSVTYLVFSLRSLLSFYQNNKFRQFDTRLTASGSMNQHELVQLLRLL